MLQSIRAHPASCLRLPVARFFSNSSLLRIDAVASAPDAPASRPSAPAQPLALPFTLGRTNSLNRAVYHRIKSGGTNKTTEIKKIEGDARVLSKMLAQELGFETKVNPRTNHVIVKGLHRVQIEGWLKSKGL